MKSLVFGAIILAAVTISSCASKGYPDTSTTITISNMQFTPNPVSISAGYTVIWSNKDATTHIISISNAGATSDSLRPGQTFSYKFSNKGTFPYTCKIHSTMSGVITVH